MFKGLWNWFARPSTPKTQDNLDAEWQSTPEKDGYYWLLSGNDTFQFLHIAEVSGVDRSWCDRQTGECVFRPSHRCLGWGSRLYEPITGDDKKWLYITKPIPTLSDD